MRKVISFITILLIIAACKSPVTGTEASEEKAVREIPGWGFFKEDHIVDSTRVMTGEGFTSLMARLGMGATRANTLTDICGDKFDILKMRADAPVEAYYDTTSRNLQYVEYHHNRIRSTIFQCGDSLAVWEYNKPTTRQKTLSDITIKSSLWNDMKAAGASTELIVSLADIYQWAVNMFALQPGDRFQVYYSQLLCEDQVLAVDTVYFANFIRDDKQVPAVLFDAGLGGRTYWGKDGESLKRMFLKAPLKYNRISSGFTYHRRHPVTGKVRAHTAVDYAAPTGTPVHAIGDGTVSVAGWDKSGGGNRIRIKHPQGYESCYMHLSRFAKGIKAGKHVSQGELIGYVGSTGMSTGPHLDFRIWHNGKPLDPLSINSPASEPLDRKYLDEFNKVYSYYMDGLSKASDRPVITAREGADEYFADAYPETEENGD